MSTATTVSTFKFPKPPTYDGTRDGFVLLAWLSALHRFFKGAHVAEDQKTLHAVVFLVGTASLWWEGMGWSDETSYDKFEKALVDEFIPTGFLDHVRHLLVTIQFKTDLPDYVSLVRKYMNILCTGSMLEGARQELEKTARAAFLQGCPEDLRRMLLSLEIGQAELPNLQALLSAAESFDRLYHFTPDDAASSSNSNKPTKASAALAASQVASQQNNPMAMEIDSLKLQLNAIMVALNHQSQPRSRPMPNYRPPPQRPPQYQQQNQQPGYRLQQLSQNDRNHLVTTGGCFRCRQPGHFARDCLKGRIAHNNIMIQEGFFPNDSSGKAPSDKV